MNRTKKTAVVIGATGLVGREVVTQLLENPEYAIVKTFARRPLGISHSKLEEHYADFRQLHLHSSEITGDVLFSCLGTTLKAAGSKEAQYEVDFTFQYEFAKLAVQNQITHYILVSALNANPKSSFFYPRIKGNLEQEIMKLPFDHISVFRPSILKGQRAQTRYAEIIGRKIIDTLKWIPALKPYRSISGNKLARAMIKASTGSLQTTCKIYNPKDIWALLRA